MTPAERDHARDARWRAVVKLLVVLGLILAVVGYIALTALGDVRKAQDDLRVTAREDAYNDCSRAVTVNAVARIATSDGENALFRDLLPMLDCSPLLDGEPPRQLSEREVQRYFRFVQERRAPPVVAEGRVLDRVNAEVLAANPISGTPPTP